MVVLSFCDSTVTTSTVGAEPACEDFSAVCEAVRSQAASKSAYPTSHSIDSRTLGFMLVPPPRRPDRLDLTSENGLMRDAAPRRRCWAGPVTSRWSQPAVRQSPHGRGEPLLRYHGRLPMPSEACR